MRQIDKKENRQACTGTQDLFTIRTNRCTLIRMDDEDHHLEASRAIFGRENATYEA